ncbi:MAG TPA: glycosyltransferase family 4 protein [Gemmatimonadota bacterium]|nr:glycosyltransferase family 4 protein [Gemmatimonadota bacterium]
MRVLLLNDAAAPAGGAEILTYDLRDGLRERGHDARVFASDALGPGPADYGCHGTTGRLRTLNRAANPRAAWRLRGVLREFRPDVVHVRMFLTQLSPLILPLLRDVPALYHAAWYEMICPTGLKLLPDGRVCREPAGRACLRCLSPPAWVALMGQRALVDRWRGVFGLYVANSDTTRRRLEEHGIGPVIRIWNGVPARPARPPLADPPTVAYSGRLSREKGVETLAEAFLAVAERIPRARLRLVGDGPLRADLERRLAAPIADGRAEVTGWLPRDAAERAMDAAWVQAVPSLLEEPFGTAAAEALMRGTAVVASDGGGPAEVVGASGGGLLVPPGDPAALADAIAGLLGDRDRAEALGAAGRAWAADRLARERCVDAFLEAYRTVVEAGP